MFGALLSAAVGAWAIAAGVAHLRRVGRVAPPDARALELELRGDDNGEAALEQLRVSGVDDDALRRAVLERRPSEAACLALDEHLGDVSSALDLGRDAALRAVRVSITAGTFGAVAELLISLSTDRAGAVVGALVAFAAGALSAGVARGLVRQADTRAASVRAGWDRVTATLGPRIRPKGAAPAAAEGAEPRSAVPTEATQRSRRRRV